jgi:hypothetical protein
MSQRLPLYNKLREDISKLQDDKFEKNILEQFDFVSWIDSKIMNTAMLNVLKKKAV